MQTVQYNGVFYKSRSRRFEKEAGIVNCVKGNRNISGLLRFCLLPYAFVMEYSCFDFDVLFGWLVSL